MTTITGAVVQAASVLFDKERTLEKLADLVRDAAATGAKLIVFPEAFVGGYPKGIDFGARLGMRSDEGRDMFRRYHPAQHRVADTVSGNRVTDPGSISEKKKTFSRVFVLLRPESHT